MDYPRIVYYHYFRHHREAQANYDVTELEVAEAQRHANRIHDATGQPVTIEVEHFEILPETGSKYHDLLASGKPTIVVMQDMRMYVQTAGVKGMRLLRESIDVSVVPIKLDDVLDNGIPDFGDLLMQTRRIINPLTDHIGDVQPHGKGRQRSDEITSLMRSAFEQIQLGRISDRDVLLDYMRTEVQNRFLASHGTISLFESTSWRTYQYKVRRRIEDLIVRTYTVLSGTDRLIVHNDVWSREAYELGQTVPLPVCVAEACIRQLDIE